MMLLVMCAVPTSGDTTVRPTVIINYDIDPPAFMPGDIGTVDISIENMAEGEIYVEEDEKTFDMNAYIASATLGGNNDVVILDDGYTNLGLLGPSDSIQLTFKVKVQEEATNGIHFLNFELIGGSDMYDLNYKIPIKVDDRDLQLVTPNSPLVVMNEISTMTIDLVNVRSNDLVGVLITSKGNDVSFTPSEVFIGTIPGGNSSKTTFTLNTINSNPGVKNITFSTSYYNGDNLHITEANGTLNVLKQSELRFTSVEVEDVGDLFTIKGDLNNVGTTDLKNVVVSVLESDCIEPIQPNTCYFIGTLEADDFSSFELSAKAKNLDVSRIPLLVEFRTVDDTYSCVNESIYLGNSVQFTMSSDYSFNGAIFPAAIGITAFICVGIVGIIGFSWKKKSEDN